MAFRKRSFKVEKVSYSRRSLPHQNRFRDQLHPPAHLALPGQPKQVQAIVPLFNVQSLYDCRTEVIVMHMPSRQYTCKTCARPVGKSALLTENDMSTIYRGKVQQNYETKMAIYRVRSAPSRYQLHLRLIFVKCG